jgi:hypothetical protein
MLKAGIEDQVASLGWTVEKAILDISSPKMKDGVIPGVIPGASKIKNAQEVSRVCKSVSEAVRDQALAGHFPLTLGKFKLVLMK